MRNLIFTSGHSGSTFLKTMLDFRMNGVAAFHEPFSKIGGESLSRAMARGIDRIAGDSALIEHCHGAYRDWVSHRTREYSTVTEVHSGHYGVWPELAATAPGRCWSLVRNGIQVVHSIWTTSMTGDSDSDNESLFVAACQHWQDQQVTADIFPADRQVRLEDLTTDSQLLGRFVKNLTGMDMPKSDIAARQARPVNQKVFGDRSPENLFWNVWRDSQREVFLDVCTDAMCRFGYAIPRPEDAPVRGDNSTPLIRLEREPVEGPLAPLWIFSSNDPDRRLLIYGRDRVAHLAAIRYGLPLSYLFHEDDAASAEAPSGIRHVPFRAAPEVFDGRIFIAVPDPLQVVHKRLVSLFAEAEIVTALPISLSPEQEHCDIAQLAAAIPPVPSGTAIPIRIPLETAGPLAVGSVGSTGWRISRMGWHQSQLFIEIVSEQFGAMQVTVKPSADHRPPYPVGEGGLFYQNSPLSRDVFNGACEQIAAALNAAIGSRSLDDMMRLWRTGL